MLRETLRERLDRRQDDDRNVGPIRTLTPMLTNRLTTCWLNTRVNGIMQTDPLSATLFALADPTRRGILAALSNKPATITEIAAPFPVSLNAISKHIMVLERAGLIHREVSGREHRCRLRPEPMREASVWLDHYRQFWDVRLDALEHHILAKRKPTRK